MSVDDNKNEGFDAAAWLNPNTRGGVIVWSTILLILPVIFYNFLVSVTNIGSDRAGVYVGVGFVVFSMIGWALTYIGRVANKDMTYAKQLRDYENGVLQKRLDELADDEIQALMQEIEEEEITGSKPAENVLLDSTGFLEAVQRNKEKKE